LNAALLGLAREEVDACFDQIVAFADIGEFINQPIKTYSSGMQMRLAFAVSVCVKPDIIIIDEALAVGDMAFQQKCLQRLAELREMGVTVLMVSHDIMLIRNYCDHTIYLEAGQVKFAGDPETAGEYYVRDMHAERQGIANEREAIRWNSDKARGKLSFGVSRGRIIHVSIKGNRGGGQSFKQGESVVIEIHGETDLDVIFPEFVFQLRDSRGYVLYGIPSSIDKLTIVKEEGRNKILARLELSLILGEGRYAATVGLNERDGGSVFSFLDKVVSVVEFDVFHGPDKRSHGCIDLGGVWKK
jgi:lipopolysaccharide transport system ATP-binding protein